MPLRPGSARGLVGIPTWFGDYVVVMTPVVVVNLGRNGRTGRIAAVVVSALALAALLLTGTRSLWLVSAGVAAVTIAVRFRTTRVERRVVVAGTVVAVCRSRRRLSPGSPGTNLRNADEGRSSAFASAIDMAARQPVLGVGPGTYGVHRLDGPLPIFAHYAFPNAHNLPLSTLAETGIVGLVALVAAALLVLVQARRVYQGQQLSDRSSGRRSLASGFCSLTPSWTS